MSARLNDLEAVADGKPRFVPSAAVSGAARKVYTQALKRWTGWDDVRLTLGATPGEVSPWAVTDIENRHVTVDADALVRNPNRVIRVVTPFRMRQEAVLTGALLHEASHARFSQWRPKNAEERAAMRHGATTYDAFDGESAPPVSDTTFDFACLLDEARIEARMIAEGYAPALEWTMHASAAALLPLTPETTNPAQQIMNLISSWVLRAGRRLGDANRPTWVNHFTALLLEGLQTYLTATYADKTRDDGSGNEVGYDDMDIMDMAADVHKRLSNIVHGSPIHGSATASGYDSGSTLVDAARYILEILFPDADDSDGDGMPNVGAACTSSAGAGQPDDSQNGQNGPQEAPDGPQSGQQPDDFQDVLDSLEAAAEQQGTDDVAEKAKQSGGQDAGHNQHSRLGDWRDPTPEEREIAKSASRFLRNLIDSAVSSKVMLTASPSASVDGAALAAWKAGGEDREPHFFKRTQRTVLPSPPVKIAVLVDISSSMSELQKPSAVLSWALSSAALDLRNFAGRGVQIESTLIHWGDAAHVIQEVGASLPGIREVLCNDGTWAMGQALDLVDEQMPGFFDITDQPVHRLLVHFTDWHLGGDAQRAYDLTEKGRAAGVDMLTITPSNWWPDSFANAQRDADQFGAFKITQYNDDPHTVWDAAADALGTK